MRTRDVVISLLAGLSLIAVFVALWFGGILFSNATADFRGNASVINKTRASGNYRIAQYDHFFDLCAAVQSTEGQITAQKGEIPFATPTRKAQIYENVDALTASRFSLIAQYNADARKSYTAGQFRSSDLPFHLDSTQETTTCTA